MPRPGKQQPRKQRIPTSTGILLIVLGACAFALFGSWYNGDLAMNPYSPEAMQSYYESQPAASNVTPANPSAPAGRSVGSAKQAGEKVRFTKVCFAAVSEEHLDRAITLAVADDETGLQEMLATGLCVQILPGTEARVIDPGFLTYEIRLTSGVYEGRAVFLPREDVSATDRIVP